MFSRDLARWHHRVFGRASVASGLPEPSDADPRRARPPLLVLLGARCRRVRPVSPELSARGAWRRPLYSPHESVPALPCRPDSDHSKTSQLLLNAADRNTKQGAGIARGVAAFGEGEPTTA